MSQVPLSHTTFSDDGASEDLLRQEELIEMAREGVDPEVIAEELGLSVPSVYRIMAEHNVVAEKRKELNKQIVELYQAGRHVNDICKELGCSVSKIYMTLHAQNIQLRRGRADTMRGDEETIIRMYVDEGATLTAIRRATGGRAISYIYDVLDRNNIPRRSKAGPWHVVQDETQ